jgi:hypothetical protein
MGLLCLFALGPVALASCIGDFSKEARRAMAEMEPQLDHSDLTPVGLTAETVTESDLLGMPRSLAVVGEHVVVSDMTGDQAFHVFEWDSGVHVNSFGRRGDGPGEFVGSAVISRVPGLTDVIDALDRNKAQVTRLELPSGEIRQIQQRDHRQIPASGFPYDFVMLATDRGVGLGLFPVGRLGFFNLTNGTADYVGEVPYTDGQPPGVVQQAYLGMLAADPSGTRIAVVTIHAGQLEIYDALGNLLIQTDGPFSFGPELTAGRQGDPERGPRYRSGYSSVAATDDHIYALFAGRAEAHFRGGWSRSYAEFVHVFTWDGELERVFKLDREVIRIALDRDGSDLLALTDTPTPGVLRFRVP